MRVSFAQVKQNIPLLTVAKSYGVALRRSGSELIGPCPLHNGDNPTAFHLNPDKNRWRCFTQCGYGDVIDFVANMEGCSLLDAAVQLATDYVPGLVQDVHPFLLSRGFDRDTLKRFSIKYSNTGRWKGMITVPIHDPSGLYMGIMARRLKHLDRGKYFIQSGLKRSQILYNYHRINPTNQIIVTEGPFDVLRLYQAGYTNAIALLGTQLSNFQLSLLVDCTVLLMLDQDEAGQRAAEQIQNKLKQVSSLTLPAKDPAELSPFALRTVLTAQGIIP